MPNTSRVHGHLERRHPGPHQEQVALHALPGALAGAAGGEDGARHPGPGLVGKPDVVELHFREAHPDRLGRELRGVDPHRIIEGVHPRGALAVPPEAAASGLDGPGGLPLGEQRILGHHDARDRIDPVGQHLPDPRLGVPRADLPVGADGDGGGDLRRVGQVAGVVLDVDHQRVHFGLVGQADQLPEPASAERPGVHVQRADLVRLAHQRRAGPRRVQVRGQRRQRGEEVDPERVGQFRVPAPVLRVEGCGAQGQDGNGQEEA